MKIPSDHVEILYLKLLSNLIELSDGPFLRIFSGIPIYSQDAHQS